MLTFLAYSMVLVYMTLIMTRPMTALIVLITLKWAVLLALVMILTSGLLGIVPLF